MLFKSIRVAMVHKKLIGIYSFLRFVELFGCKL